MIYLFWYKPLEYFKKLRFYLKLKDIPFIAKFPFQEHKGYMVTIFKPNETAENLRKYGGYIPGIRPGESTALYIDSILTKLTTIGALYLALVCLMPEFLIAKYPIPFYLGGTSILIVVIVAMDTVTQVQTRLMSSQYQNLIKK